MLDKQAISLYNMRRFFWPCLWVSAGGWYKNEKKRQETCSRSITWKRASAPLRRSKAFAFRRSMSSIRYFVFLIPASRFFAPWRERTDIQDKCHRNGNSSFLWLFLGFKKCHRNTYLHVLWLFVLTITSKVCYNRSKINQIRILNVFWKRRSARATVLALEQAGFFARYMPRT